MALEIRQTDSYNREKEYQNVLLFDLLLSLYSNTILNIIRPKTGVRNKNYPDIFF